MAFSAKNPKLSNANIVIRLHFDLEPQKTYKPGYPIEKRGYYYLSRRFSSQLSLVFNDTDYNSLEKCYSIWICRDDIPKDFITNVITKKHINFITMSKNKV